MGTLTRLSDGFRCALLPRAILGRGTAATIRLGDRFASSEHARLLWTGSAWELRDLGSRNGTFVDGVPLPAGSSKLIEAGAKLGFGEAEAGWVLDTAEAPGASAVDVVDGHLIAGTGELLVLPDPDAPEITVFRGADGGWRYEEAGEGARLAANHQTLEVAGRTFRLELPEASDLTPMADAAFSLANVTVRLHVPTSMERISIELVHLHRREWLEPREHSFLLYVLAKERGADRDKPLADRGWRSVPWLTKALRADDAALNVLIHRARLQLANAGVDGAAEIVEVKRGQRRLGTDRFEIVPATVSR